MRLRDRVQKVVEEYGEEVSIGIFGSHSAKEIGAAAKAAGFRLFQLHSRLPSPFA